MKKNIQIGIGIGDVKFGMSPDQVKALLGEPDEVNKQVYSDEDPDYYSIEWHYDAIEMSVVFDMMETLELATISISSESFTLEGNSLIGNTIEKVMALLDKTDLSSEWEELEEEEDNSRSFVNEEEGLSLYFEDGLLSELQLEML
jgi:hypothetical protein